MRIPLPLRKGLAHSHKLFPELSLCLILAMFVATPFSDLAAEGSKDLAESAGYRLFLDTRDTQQLKVYANVGEFLNIGSSHLGIEGGFITVYRPDGTMAMLIDGSNGNEGIIFNKAMEDAGPTGGGSTNGAGYEPAVLEVGSDEAGIWTVYFGYPTYSSTDFPNILNSAAWTRATDQPKTPRVVLAWDVTVTKQNAGNYGGQPIFGRVYANELILIINQNGYHTSPSFHVLTKQGFIFKIEFHDADPFRFPISSNSSGFVKHDFLPVYSSQPRSMIVKSDDPATWTSGSYYLYEPQAEDYGNGLIINNKIFFNYPNDDMPSTAKNTDVFRENTHETWLKINPLITTLDINDVQLLSANNSAPPCPQGILEVGSGAIFNFNSNLSGTAILKLDINKDGDFEDSIDRILYQQIQIGNNNVFWETKDGEGHDLPTDINIAIDYEITMRGGESHVLLTDVENNQGGVSFYLENSGQNNNNDLFFYDHTPISAPVSGGGWPGNAMPTNVPFTYQNGFGNNNILDYWAFYEYDGKAIGTIKFLITDDCNSDPGPDRDGDGIPDSIDIDDDNDGVADKSEFCNPVTGYACLPGGLDPSADADADGIQNFEDADDPNFANPCPDINADGICDEIAGIYDTDGDRIPDHFDLDSDNDGIPDLVEAGHGQPDVDRNGVIDGLPIEFGANGLYNAIASDPDNLNAIETYSRYDADADLIPDYDDLDSDNDGIHDVEEGGHAISDSNNDGRIDDGNGNIPITGMTGLAPQIDPLITGQPIPSLLDFDGDAVPDWHDLDSDNDLIHDVEEGGNKDADNDGMIGVGLVPVDINGLAVGVGIFTTSNPMDSDGDIVPNYHDLDTDNDGINDVKEADGNDPDNDGFPETGIITIDDKGRAISANGIILTTTSNPKDTDTDLVCDYMDLDSDNDIITDIAEHNYPDPDNDGMVGLGVANVNIFGQSIDHMPTSVPTDTDGDGTPDFQELDSDGDGVLDVREANQSDPDFDGIIGTGMPNVDIYGTSVDYLATSKPTDSDGDGIPDFQEIDSDNDGILDVYECPDPSDCTDGDGDNTADFQDPDRDNDGIFDGYECETGFPCPDTDGDGIPDLDDLDTDGDMLSDSNECPAGDPCPDANLNGIPEWREFFCNPNVIVPIVENVTSNGTSFCIGSTASLTGENSIDVAGDSVLYQWVGPNGFQFSKMTTEFGPFPIDIPNLSHNYEGEFTLYLYTEDGCVGEPGSVNIDFDLTPSTPEIQPNTNQLCVGSSILLTANGYPGTDVNYQWYFDDGSGPELIATSTDSVLSITDVEISQSGIYSVQVEVNNCMSLMSSEQEIEVVNIVAQTPGLAVDNDILCVGDLIELNSTIVQGGNVTYEWWFNDGSGDVSLGITDVPTFFIQNANISNTGVYNVSVHLNGCESQKSNSQDIVVSDILTGVQPFLNVDENQLCDGGSLQLSTAAVSGNNIEYTWWFDDGNGMALIGTSNNPSFTINDLSIDNAGTYSVIINSGNCNSPTSNSQEVEIDNSFSSIYPEISVQENQFCEGESLEFNSAAVQGNNVQYEWWFNNGNGAVLLETTAVPAFNISDATVSNSGEYFIIVTNGLCQSSPSAIANIDVSDDFNSQTPALSILQDQPCEGELIELNASILSGGNITYNWWFDNGNGFVLLTTTDLPTYFIPDASFNDSGIYAVTASFGNCETQFSNAQDIEVTENLSSQTPQLDASQNLICEGEMLTLSSSVVTGNNVTYEWWFDDGTGFISLGTTNVPTFFINDINANNEGIYQVTFSIGNCTSQYSNSQAVEVTENLSNQTPLLAANSSNFCIGESLELNSSIVTGGNVTYEWFFNDGSGPVSLGTTDIPTYFIDDLELTDKGIYTVQVSVGNCTSQQSNAQQINVTNLLNQSPTLTADNDVVCEGGILELNSSTVSGNNVTYHWWFDNGNSIIQVAITDHPTLFIENASNGDEGIYMVSVSVGDCTSQLSNAQDVVIEMSPNLELSNTTDSVNVACVGDIVELSAPFVLGANYQWIGPNGFQSESINPILENVSSKNAGAYSVVVETVNGCAFISESTEVFVFDDLFANEDFFQITTEDSITTEDWIENDEISNISNWEITIVSQPVNGRIEFDQNGQPVYYPQEGQVGNDVFIYMICNPDCPDQCEEAVVNVRVYRENDEDEVCFIPNVITPNDDGANDGLVIPCLETEFSNNNLKIFNRWGDLVFEAQPYQNNWKGTYRNTQLPPGTYFYVLQLDTSDDHCLQGYFTLTR